MFCDQSNKCEDCKFWTKMYARDEEGNPKEEWDCVFKWHNIMLSEISAKLSYVIESNNKEEKETT